MPSTRQDAWSHTDDVRLAETVLQHISEGSTQLAAFAEAGVLLSRTPAACGFRWNSSVRKQYEQDLKEAKIKRREAKNRKKQMKTLQSTGTAPRSLLASGRLIDQIQRLLNQLKNEYTDYSSSDTVRKLQQLQEEYNSLQDSYNLLENDFNEMKSNYDSLVKVLKIVDQARQQIPEKAEDRSEWREAQTRARQN